MLVKSYDVFKTSIFSKLYLMNEMVLALSKPLRP